MQVDPLKFIIIAIIYILSLKMSEAEYSFTRLLHLYEKLAQDEKFAGESVCLSVCLCVRACMRVCVCCECVHAYICRGCCNIKERIKIDTGEWAVGTRLWCCKIV